MTTPTSTQHTTSMGLEATPGARMLYLIRRRPSTSREELVAHWYANHMPAVIARAHDQAAAGQPHARRYLVTLFDATAQGEQPWDGVAQLWWDQAQPMPEVPSGTVPSDSFQERAEPYLPWATTEYVVMDPSERLSVEPLTLNAPYPSTRSGFYKVSFLVAAQADADLDALYAHWLGVHVPNVRSVMQQVGGFGYVVSHSMQSEVAPYAGMAELYFADESGWADYQATITSDGMGQWLDGPGMVVMGSRTEFIGIP